MSVRRLSLVLIGWFVLAGCTEEIPYQGQTVRMRIRRWGGAAYPEVHREDVPKVQRIMRTTAFPATFRTSDELSRAVFDLKLPNYGLWSGDFKSPSGVPLELFCVEIPDSATERCLLYARQGDGTYARQDDFIAPDVIGRTIDARVEPDRILYLGRDGRVVWSRPMRIR